MSRAPAVSVVIPVHNSAAFVCRTLDTVGAQTFTDYETIVVDDGSTDGTDRVVQEYFAAHGMRGEVLRQRHRGMAAARNTGMRAAGGMFIALLDSDDLWHPTKLAMAVAEFDHDSRTDLVCHDERLVRDGRVVRVTRRRASRGNLHERLLFDGNILSPSAVIVRRDAALDAGGFDERPEYLTVEDYDFWLRFSRTRRITFLDAVLGDCILREGSASRRIVFHHEALETMLRHHLSAYLREHPGWLARLRARRRLARVYRSAARQLIAHREHAHAQHAFVARMLRTYPFEVRNVAVACLWVTGMLKRPAQVTQS